MSKTIVIGPLFCDLLLDGFKRVPNEGEELFLEKIPLSVGGAAITAIALAQLGISTQLISFMGDDVFGQYILNELSSKNIDISSLHILPNAGSNLTLIFPYANDRGFITKNIKDNQFSEIIKESLDSYDFTDINYIHLTFSLLKQQPIGDFIKKAIESGVAVSVDLGFEEAVHWSDEDYKYIQGIDFFMPNNKESKLITKLDSIEDSLYRLKQWVKHPIITLGKEGAAFLDEKNKFHIIPAQETNAVNTSGAGDSFTAGFLYGLSCGLSIYDSVKRGIVAGTLTAESYSSVSSRINTARIEKLAKL